MIKKKKNCRPCGGVRLAHVFRDRNQVTRCYRKVAVAPDAVLSKTDVVVVTTVLGTYNI